MSNYTSQGSVVRFYGSKARRGAKAYCRDLLGRSFSLPKEEEQSLQKTATTKEQVEQIAPKVPRAYVHGYGHDGMVY